MNSRDHPLDQKLAQQSAQIAELRETVALAVGKINHQLQKLAAIVDNLSRSVVELESMHNGDGR